MKSNFSHPLPITTGSL